MSASVRVGLVARSVNLRHVRGTGRYVQELLRHLGPAEGVDWIAYGHDPSQPFQLPAGYAGAQDVFSFRGDRLELWEQLGLPRRLGRQAVHVLHGADNTVPWWQPVPTVVTIHDTVPWAEPPSTSLQRLYLHGLQPLAFRRCAAIITISSHSRHDILARWPLLEPRLVVIPHGIAPEFFRSDIDDWPAGLAEALGGAPYLLYVGGGQAKKRFDWALQVLQGLQRPDLHLVACGFSEAAAAAARTAGPAELRGRVHFTPFIRDAQLVTLYRRARATLYPTLYEGFGFPAVESQAAGTPVVFSPVTSLVDLVGPLSWNPSPHDAGGWLDAVAHILSLSPDELNRRADEARRWSARFSWAESARRHRELYAAVAAGQGPGR